MVDDKIGDDSTCLSDDAVRSEINRIALSKGPKKRVRHARDEYELKIDKWTPEQEAYAKAHAEGT